MISILFSRFPRQSAWLMLLSLVFLHGMSLAAQSITVNYPNGGEKRVIWGTTTITWSSVGVSGNVKIELLKAGSIYQTINADTANSGSYGWFNSNEQKLGGDFKIRITSLSTPAVLDESDGDFCITSDSFDPAVPVTATIQRSPAQITLNWNRFMATAVTGYSVYRRAPSLSISAGWGTALATGIAKTETSWTDTSAMPGVVYEYKVNRDGYGGTGYVDAGIDVPMVEDRGKVILVVDNTMAAELAPELTRLQQDLVGDGWTVIRHDVDRHTVDTAGWKEAVAALKALIKADYDADPGKVNSVLLFGHVPVAYSGNLAPDGHGDHYGAWPADVYYADMDGTWTDTTVTSTSSSDPAQHNIPGDGKFDQSSLYLSTSTALFPELAVGRVDLYGMNAFTIKNERELLRQYLNKDHNYRHKILTAQPRVLNDANFGSEGFGQVGYRSFATLTGGDDRVFAYDWNTALASNDYLFGDGSGAGSNNSCDRVSTTNEFAAVDPKVIFTALFGSYFADWDHADNLLRAPLATSYGLTCVWSGRPNWYFHSMGMGETVGSSHRLSQYWAYSSSGVHMALMGDPTLRLHAVQPATRLVATSGTGSVALTWSASTDTDIQGYHVYRSTSALGPFARLTGGAVSVADPAGSPLVTTAYNDSTASVGTTYTYMVRAVKNESGFLSGGASYLNPSQGIFATITATSGTVPPAAPTSLAVAGTSRTSFTLNWIDNASSETGFKIERKIGGAGSWSPLTTVAANITTYPDTTATAGQVNYYRVCATNANGDSAWSNEAADYAVPGSLFLQTTVYAADKASGTFSIPVRRTWGALGTVSVNYATSDQTAIAGTHYTTSTGTLTWNNGDFADKVIVVPLANLAGAQPQRAFKVALSAPTGGAVLGNYTTAYAQITDATDATVPAEWTAATIGGVNQAGAARYANGTHGLSVTAGPIGGTNDSFRYTYQAVSGDFDIVARIVNQDFISTSGAAGVMLRASTANNAANVFALSNPVATMFEQRRTTLGGSTTIADSTGSLPSPQWVRINRTGNTITTYRSTNGVDWTQMGTGSLAMTDPVLAGIAYTVCNSTINGNAIFDNVSITPFTNDSGSLSFSAASYSANESAGTATITVSRTGGSDGPASVQYTTSDGTATVDNDYTAATGTLNWADGDAADKTFTVTIANDALDEADETVNIALSNATGATLGTLDTSTLTITDDDAAPTVTFTVASQSCAENAGTATITAQLSGESGWSVSVPLTVTGTATNPDDYTLFAPSKLSVTIAAGSTTGTVTVNIVDDAVYENPDETVIFTMGTPTHATLGATTVHTLTITNNDPPPSTGTLAFSSATCAVAENGTSATITVSRTGGSDGPASVQYATSDGTATAGSDYTATTGTLNWADGNAADQTFTVTIANDALDEADETVNLALSNATGATLGTPNTAVLTIIDDDDMALELIAVGSLFDIGNDEVGLAPAQFNVKPKVTTAYTDPVTFVSGKKATAKVITKVSARLPADSIACEWTKRIRLYNAKLLTAARKAGMTTATWLAADPNRQQHLDLPLHLISKQVDDQPVRTVSLTPPEINAVTVQDATIEVTGTWFGTKKPKVWMEYSILGKGIKKLNGKVMVPDGSFLDTKGKAIFMNQRTGESKVVIGRPVKLPSDVTDWGEITHLVIDNGSGIAAAEIDWTP